MVLDALAAQAVSYEVLPRLAVHLLATWETLGLALHALGLALEVGQASHQGHLQTSTCLARPQNAACPANRQAGHKQYRHHNLLHHLQGLLDL